MAGRLHGRLHFGTWAVRTVGRKYCLLCGCKIDWITYYAVGRVTVLSRNWQHTCFNLPGFSASISSSSCRELYRIMSRYKSLYWICHISLPAHSVCCIHTVSSYCWRPSYY